jgi:hypothetical protein
MLLVRSPEQRAQGLELIRALGGEQEGRRWRVAVGLLKTSAWSWTTGFAPCAQRILGVGARRDRLLRRFSVDCALHLWRGVPLTAPAIQPLWPRPWKTSRAVLTMALSQRPDRLSVAYTRARRETRWVYRRLDSQDEAIWKLYHATQITRAACIVQAGRAVMETANHLARYEGAALSQAWFVQRLLEESQPEWFGRVPG